VQQVCAPAEAYEVAFGLDGETRALLLAEQLQVEDVLAREADAELIGYFVGLRAGEKASLRYGR